MRSGFVDSGTGIVVKDPFFRTWAQDQAGHSLRSVEERERFAKVAGRRGHFSNLRASFSAPLSFAAEDAISPNDTSEFSSGWSPVQVQERLPGAAHFFRRAELKVIGQ
jgi:hypothetical protein